MADSQNLIGQGMGIAMDEIYRALFGNAAVKARQGQPITAGDVGDTAFTVGLNSLPFGGGGAAARASKVTPEGLDALARVIAMQRRSRTAAPDRLVPEADRVIYDSGNAAFGPGTYFSNRAASKDAWSNLGDNIQKLRLNPKGYLQVAQSKGFKSVDDLGFEPMGKSIKDPEVQKLLKEGYIGVSKDPRKGSIADDVQTIFDPASLSGARLKDIGQMNSANRWVNTQNPVRTAENAYRDAMLRYSQKPSDYSKGVRTSPNQSNAALANAARRRAIEDVINRLRREKLITKIEPEA